MPGRWRPTKSLLDLGWTLASGKIPVAEVDPPSLAKKCYNLSETLGRATPTPGKWGSLNVTTGSLARVRLRGPTGPRLGFPEGNAGDREGNMLRAL